MRKPKTKDYLFYNLYAYNFTLYVLVTYSMEIAESWIPLVFWNVKSFSLTESASFDVSTIFCTRKFLNIIIFSVSEGFISLFQVNMKSYSKKYEITFGGF